MGNKLNVLIIEDDRLCAELLSNKLFQTCNVTYVQTLKAGLAALDAGKFDAVLLDLGLTNGMKDTVVDEVNAHRGEAAIVVVTGDINPQTRYAALLNKADAFVVKGQNDTQEDLEWTIRWAIDHRKEKDAG